MEKATIIAGYFNIPFPIICKRIRPKGSKYIEDTKNIIKKTDLVDTHKTFHLAFFSCAVKAFPKISHILKAHTTLKSFKMIKSYKAYSMIILELI